MVLEHSRKCVESELANERRNRQQNLEWLGQHDSIQVSFSESFSHTSPQDLLERWFCLKNATPDPEIGPLTLLDFRDPGAIFERRINIEVSTTAVVFASSFVPIVGGVIGDLYESLVAASEDRNRIWEARLISALEISEASGGIWDRELTNSFPRG